MSQRFLKTSAVTLLVAAGLFSIISVGGCPAPQTPTTPPTTGDEDQSAQQDDLTTDNGLDRPIQPPNLDTTTSGSGDSVTTSTEGDGGGGGDGGGDGQGGPGLVLISIGQPADDIAVAAPPRTEQSTLITLEFNLIDSIGAVTTGDLLLARDNNADGLPDGDPVHTQSIALSAGSNIWLFDTDTVVQKGLLTNNFGCFVLGVRATTISNDVTEEYSTATITIDGIAPTATWEGAGPTQALIDFEDHLVSRDTSWTLGLETGDNSPHTWRVLLDMDLTPENGTEFELVAETDVPADTGTRTPPHPLSLTIFPAGTYYYYVIVSDGIAPDVKFYAPGVAADTYARLAITDRLIGEFDLNQLIDDEPSNPSQSKGAIMEGYNFNDLAGSSMVSVPDLDGDGDSELIIGARFGKPNLNFFEGTGWGEAYMIYGGGGLRLTGAQALNSVGSIDDPSQGGIPGVTFRGIRVPQNTDWTEGLADIAVINDMDGDDLPEIVFSFPRAESICLEEVDPTIQHPDLVWDEEGMGRLEYNAFHNPGDPSMFDNSVWHMGEAQFTRGGIVIISSHNEMLKDNDIWTRHGDRVLDLQEIGQMFNFMARPSLDAYIRRLTQTDAGCEDCDDGTSDCGGIPDNPNETEFIEVTIEWDVWLGGGGGASHQGPGGFHMPWTVPAANPPLANWLPHNPLCYG